MTTLSQINTYVTNKPASGTPIWSIDINLVDRDRGGSYSMPPPDQDYHPPDFDQRFKATARSRLLAPDFNEEVLARENLSFDRKHLSFG